MNKSDSKLAVVLTVLDTLSEVNGSSLPEITNAYSRNCGVAKTDAAARVKMAIAQAKSIGYVKEGPKGSYSLVGLKNFLCSNCAKHKHKRAKARARKLTKRKTKGVAKKSRGILKQRATVKKTTKVVKKATKKK